MQSAVRDQALQLPRYPNSHRQEHGAPDVPGARLPAPNLQVRYSAIFLLRWTAPNG